MTRNGARDLPAHQERDRCASGHELERAELERLIAIASHDLREPLRAINGFGDLLERESGEQLGERGREFLAMIRQAGARMDDLLEGLGRYGRAGRPSAGGPVEMDLEEALETALERMRARVVARHAEITHDPLPLVQADPAGVQEVLEQLIDNATKFHDGPVPHVHVQADCDEEGWELTVLDDGIGVPERERDRIFEMYGRLHPRGAYEGNGVGLAVARRVVQRLGGRIWVENGPGRGSAFHVQVPTEGRR